MHKTQSHYYFESQIFDLKKSLFKIKKDDDHAKHIHETFLSLSISIYILQMAKALIIADFDSKNEFLKFIKVFWLYQIIANIKGVIVNTKG